MKCDRIEAAPLHNVESSGPLQRVRLDAGLDGR